MREISHILCLFVAVEKKAINGSLPRALLITFPFCGFDAKAPIFPLVLTIASQKISFMTLVVAYATPFVVAGGVNVIH